MPPAHPARRRLIFDECLLREWALAVHHGAVKAKRRAGQCLRRHDAAPSRAQQQVPFALDTRPVSCHSADHP